MTDYLTIDWRGRDRGRLERMRSLFLARSEDGEPAATGDYWLTDRDLELYDATYGARIGWKWDSVLAEALAAGLGAGSAAGEAWNVVDWGCGTGIAARRAFAAGLIPGGARVFMDDRSSPARSFAAGRLREASAELDVRTGSPPPGAAIDLALISHVLSELDTHGLDQLQALARRAARVVWVEPGARSIARGLSEVREGLLATHLPLAPCPHSGACGTLAPGNEDQWCHHFPEPPQEAFIEGFWARFGQELEIDRRSLATSFLVLMRRDLAPEHDDDPTRARILGRPRIEKGKATADVCDASGVTRCELWKRDAPRVWRTWKKASRATLDYRFEREGTRIRRVLSGPGVDGSTDTADEE
ncbi:small ribosomal subunit Rsm22 family protein [Engelhardtia mirabilis]|uniref:Mitochondrial small ribosomal subunit Rsm22 n=1 Tax=Engelhardtia mirabilis TaxID=2528011 RepID=A0A518BLM0_9BACT|nr:Mitochondrial small ribosomal subunit Rsm22 [Planctomycetes bacterium Pla133]QDV02194.1 Mitochondrial small ribosomal subunit Rsm22 [Planctomycetes bacterium Pla86]